MNEGLTTKARETTLELGDTTVKGVIDKLVEDFGNDFERRILDDKGEVRRFVNLCVNGEDIRHLSCLLSPVKDADEISNLPAVRGG